MYIGGDGLAAYGESPKLSTVHWIWNESPPLAEIERNPSRGAPHKYMIWGNCSTGQDSHDLQGVEQEEKRFSAHGAG